MKIYSTRGFDEIPLKCSLQIAAKQKCTSTHNPVLPEGRNYSVAPPKKRFNIRTKLASLVQRLSGKELVLSVPERLSIGDRSSLCLVNVQRLGTSTLHR